MEVDDRLLRAIAEQLKLPLLQIARHAELAQSAHDAEGMATISYVADTALRLVDGYLLGAELATQGQLDVEPVSVSAVLQDTAHRLSPLAKQNDCELELSIGGRYGPVMAHRQSLESALLLLGHSLIETRTVENKRHRVVLAAHRSGSGLVTGAFDNQPGIGSDMLRRGKALYGSARQPLPTMSGANGAGVFVADNLLRAMEAPLRVARHHKLTGLAATLHQSSQLSLV